MSETPYSEIPKWFIKRVLKLKTEKVGQCWSCEWVNSSVIYMPCKNCRQFVHNIWNKNKRKEKLELETLSQMSQ